MDLKTKILFSFVIASLIIPFSAFADTTTTTLDTTSSTPASTASTTASSVLGLQTSAVPQLIAQIKEAKTKLADVKLNYALNPVYKKPKVTKKNPKPKAVLTGYNLWAKDMALAILDPATNQISITAGMQTGKTISFKDTNFDIKLKNFNGVNSSFTVNKPAGGVVLALKYLITGPETGSKSSIISNLQEAIYVPYSDNLYRTDVVAYGETYIDNLIKRAAKDLSYIPSQAVPGKMITEAIRPALIRALVYAEHTDTATVLQGGNIQDTINRLNILFAANEGDTYKYSVSTAGARGISQFMPSTYQSLVQRHNEAGLISDSVIGLNDHYNSIKAMYLLIDDYAGTVRAKASGFSEGLVFDYGAAAYNGGTTRVIKAVNALGANWNQDQSGQISFLQSQAVSLKAQIKKAKDKKTKLALQSQLSDVNNQLSDLQSAALRTETVNYLQKIYKVIPVFNSDEI